jgi:hypothetical protein
MSSAPRGDQTTEDAGAALEGWVIKCDIERMVRRLEREPWMSAMATTRRCSEGSPSSAGGAPPECGVTAAGGEERDELACIPSDGGAIFDHGVVPPSTSLSLPADKEEKVKRSRPSVTKMRIFPARGAGAAG